MITVDVSGCFQGCVHDSRESIGFSEHYLRFSRVFS